MASTTAHGNSSVEPPARYWHRLLRPRYLLGHLACAALFLLTLQLGWWQWERAALRGWDAQNLSYAVQWPVYGLMGLWFYGKMMWLETERDPFADDPGVEVVLYRQPRIDTTGDPQLAAYNAYLADLNAQVLKRRRP